MKTVTLLFCLLFSCQFLSAQSYLRAADQEEFNWFSTADPSWPDWVGHAELDSVRLLLRPRGIYTEVDFFANIRQGDAYDWGDDGMEVVWQFRLPANSIIHDSWLWIEDEIVQAEVIDFWTASQIYEDIVGVAQDPSLLYQLSDGRYEIRIFPLFDGEYRRIKMSFLLPNDWDEHKVTTQLLLPLFQATNYHPETVEVIASIDSEWQNPRLTYSIDSTETSHDFSTGSLPDFGPVGFRSVPGDSLFTANGFSISYDAPWSDSVRHWSTTYAHPDGEQFYQVVYRPDFDTLTGISGIVDLDIDLTGGLTFQNHYFYNGLTDDASRLIFAQVGRYGGDFAGDLTATIFTDSGALIQQNVLLDGPNVVTTDTIYRKTFYGNQLRNMAFQSADTSEYAAIAQMSIDERVLIPLTAFLALEPSLGGEVCIPCLEPQILIIETEEILAEATLRIYPNPIVDEAVVLIENIELPETILTIRDLNGREITRLLPTRTGAGNTTWQWRPTGELPAGVYTAEVRVGEKILVQKIVLTR